MATVSFDAAADEAMSRLEADPAARRLCSRVQAVLDLLESDPGSSRLRQLRYTNGLWGVVVVSTIGTVVILWEPHPTEPNEVVVQYLGPASFA
ncbi:MAG: hypothetical protein QOG82_423 [Actinomycetota bacterium]|jgi:hypothetical protein|nr:hypothetical protein [Actinomycetota bacterium]